MQEVSASEFARNFGRYRDVVQREPVAITNHGRPTSYLVSAVEFEELQRYKRIARQSLATSQLSKADIDAIGAGRMSADHDSLNALLDD